MMIPRVMPGQRSKGEGWLGIALLRSGLAVGCFMESLLDEGVLCAFGGSDQSSSASS